MSDELEELFGTSGGSPAPRRGLIVGLLTGGLITTLLGMACTAAPGGILVLIAWVVVDKELDRVDSGYLPADCRPEVQRLRQVTLAGVGVVLVLFVVQIWLFAAGFYEDLFVLVLQSLLEMTGT